MNKLLCVVMTALISGFYAFGANRQPQVSPGTVVNVPQFASSLIPARDIHVWIPEDYNPNKRYGVLYMHDGQAIFDPECNWNHQTWNIDSVAGALIGQGLVEPFIVVGIDNTEAREFEYMPQRAMDYLPASDSLLLTLDRNQFVADNYLKFIATELKPWIDAHYYTYTDAGHTAIMGSSMGALISLYALCEYPDVFGGAACLSMHSPMTLVLSPTSADTWSLALRNYLKDNLPRTNTRRIYIDIGDQTLDALYPHFQDLLDAQIEACGWTAPFFKSARYENAAHDEVSWERRLHIPVLFLFGK